MYLISLVTSLSLLPCGVEYLFMNLLPYVHFLPPMVVRAWWGIPQLALLLGSVLPSGCMGRQDRGCYGGLIGLQGWTL